MKRAVEMALSEFVETDKELKTFEGSAHKALAMQAAYYLGLNTDIVTTGEKASAICIGRLIVMFRPIEDSEHIKVVLVGPLYDLEEITFMYKKPSDIYPLVNMIAKASGAMDTTEMQVLRYIQAVMRKARLDTSFTYGEIKENTYGVIVDIEIPEIEKAKARFYLQAIESDLETIVTCKAAIDICDGLEAKNECASIATKEACLYMLEMFAQVHGVDLKSKMSTTIH